MLRKKVASKFLSIREASFKDLFRIVKIERQNFSKPWGFSGFSAELLKKDNLFLVAEIDGNVVGYIVCWILFDEAYIANIAVDINYQGMGIGSRLMESLFDVLSSKEIKRCTLEVRVSNVRAQKLYNKFGFKVVGIRKKMYHDGEDGFVMEAIIPEKINLKEVCYEGRGDHPKVDGK